jgi:hypothetical protein
LYAAEIHMTRTIKILTAVVGGVGFTNAYTVQVRADQSRRVAELQLMAKVLKDFVQVYWSELLADNPDVPDRPDPQDPEGMVQLYFERHASEWMKVGEVDTLKIEIPDA